MKRVYPDFITILFLLFCLFCFLFCLFCFGTFNAFPLTSPNPKAESSKYHRKNTIPSEGSFENPDFNFPKTVLKNARPELKKSLESGDEERAFKALLEICAAESSISSEDISSRVALVDSVSALISAGWHSLGLLLEADMLREAYSCSPHKYSDRKLPESKIPGDINLWDGNMFRTQIKRLIEKSLSAAPADSPLTKYSSILNSSSTSGFLLIDFLYAKAVSILKSVRKSSDNSSLIPFTLLEHQPITETDSSQATMLSVPKEVKVLLNRWEELLSLSTNPLRWSLFLSIKFSVDNPGSEAEWFKDKWNEWEGTQYQPLLLPYISSKSVSQEISDNLSIPDINKIFYSPSECYLRLKNFLKSEKSDYSGKEGTEVSHLIKSQVENMLEEWEQPSISFSIPSYIVPAESFPVEMNVDNVTKGEVIILEIPESYPVEDSWLTDIKALSDFKRMKRVAEVPFSSSRTIPFNETIKFSLPPLDPGRYTAIVSLNGTLDSILLDNGAIKDSSFSIFNVSGLSSFSLDTKGGKSDIFIAGSVDSAPIPGARITLSATQKNTTFHHQIYTDSAGAVTLPSFPDNIYQLKMTASKGKDQFFRRIYRAAKFNQEDKRKTFGNILFDRPIARPGDEVRFVVIAYDRMDRKLSPSPKCKLKMILMDAAYAPVDTLYLVTDEYGRCEGKVIIPEGRLLGQWSLSAFNVTENSNSDNYLTSNSIRIEEYKNPTSRLTLDRPENVNDSVIKISGRVETYTGMPISQSEVSLNISTRRPWWWRWNAPEGTFSAKAQTGVDGRFEVQLGLVNIKGTPFDKASYQITANSTSPEGEIASDTETFSLGESSVIIPDLNDKIEVTSDIVDLNVRVLDSTGNPEKRTLFYQIKSLSDSSFVPLTGSFTSPLLKIDSGLLPSGTYSAEFALDRKEFQIAASLNKSEATSNKTTDSSPKSDTTSTFIVWRQDDVSVPSLSPIWIPETEITAGFGKDVAKVKFGSCYPGQYILFVVSDSKHEISRRWIKTDGKMIEEEVPVPSDSERIFVNLLTIRDFSTLQSEITILPSSERKRLEVQTLSFRDHTVSGSSEKWQFRFTNGPERGATDVAAIALMTDSALESLAPLHWNFSPRSLLYWDSASQFNVEWIRNAGFNFYRSIRNSKPVNILSKFPREWVYLPYSRLKEIYYYAEAKSMTTGSVPINNGIKIRGSAKMDMADEIAEDAVSLEAGADYDNRGESVDGSEDKKNKMFREPECPVALFLPMLKSDDNGMLSIEVDVPDFNTEWNFRLTGYDHSMDVARLSRSVISSKPVMIRTSLPRFVRTGDRVLLTARAYNNSVHEIDLRGRIEVLDPVTKKIISEEEISGMKTAPTGSCLLSVELCVPTTLDAVIVRATAEGATHTDGEQVLLPILPSSSPVIESIAYYLSPAQDSYSLKIPRLNKNSTVTLMYCDNPVWYCLTSLPAMIESKGVTATALLNSFYGNSIASGLISTHEYLKKGLKEILQSGKSSSADMTVSNLEKNLSMKLRDLGATPWLNSAVAETSRMESLVNLLDSVRSEKILGSLLEKIHSLQSEDGGILWYPEAKESSEWCTSQLLLRFSMLDNFGYLNEDDARVKDIVGKGFNFLTTGIIKRYEKLKKNFKDDQKAFEGIIPSLTDYLLITSRFRSENLFPKENRELSSLLKRTVAYLRDSWGTLSIYDRANASIILFNRGEKPEAERILSSLSQLAKETDGNGMWFDNLEGGMFSPVNKLITTSRVLEAYSQIVPTAPEIDSLRQWLILQRQTEDWGKLLDSAELTQAILTSGTEWTAQLGEEREFTIKVNNEVILDSKEFSGQGEKTISIDPETLSGKELKIERKGNSPAWGGLVEQYVAPLKKIEPARIPDLSIDKSIYLLKTDAGSEKAISIDGARELTIGDKIRVLLTVDCKRDMEYVVLTDQRGACLEPTEQLSGVENNDGRILYREVRNTETGFFIEYLPKGQYQFSYDCLITSAGDFTAGIASIQSQYAPQLTAHSGAVLLQVRTGK